MSNNQMLCSVCGKPTNKLISVYKFSKRAPRPAHWDVMYANYYYYYVCSSNAECVTKAKSWVSLGHLTGTRDE